MGPSHHGINPYRFILSVNTPTTSPTLSTVAASGRRSGPSTILTNRRHTILREKILMRCVDAVKSQESRKKQFSLALS